VKTVVVQIGNSDDKLTQKEWSNYWHEIDGFLREEASEIHFCGTSAGAAPWQNACWVFSTSGDKVGWLLAAIAIIRENYDQDSAAALVGDVEFV